MIVLISLLVFLAGQASASNESGDKPLPVAVQGCDPDLATLQSISSKVQTAAEELQTDDIVWQVYSICHMKSWAYAFLKGFSPDSLEPLPFPSEVVLARLVGDEWQIAMPGDGPLYNAWLDEFPTRVLGKLKNVLYQPVRHDGPYSVLNFSGYYLPYPNGNGANVYKHNYSQVDFGILGAGSVGTVTGHNTIPKNGQIEFPTLTDGVRVNDNSLVSQVVEEDAAHGTSGGTIHDSGAFS